MADTSALITLAVCESLDVLEVLFTAIRVPEAVYREAVIAEKPHCEVLRRFLRDRVEAVDMSRLVIAAPGLGAGELEAMVLYRKLSASRLLIDDGRARKIARLNGIAVVGSLGVLLAAKKRGLVDAIAPMIERLRQSTIFVSEALLEEVLRRSGEGP